MKNHPGMKIFSMFSLSLLLSSKLTTFLCNHKTTRISTMDSDSDSSISQDFTGVDEATLKELDSVSTDPDWGIEEEDSDPIDDWVAEEKLGKESFGKIKEERNKRNAKKVKKLRKRKLQKLEKEVQVNRAAANLEPHEVAVIVISDSEEETAFEEERIVEPVQSEQILEPDQSLEKIVEPPIEVCIELPGEFDTFLLLQFHTCLLFRFRDIKFE